MKTAILTFLLLTSGCATITNGTNQTIDFSPPEGQPCAVIREGSQIGTVSVASPSITVARSRDPITLDCGGSVQVVESSINKAGYTSITFIDFGIVDFITGALWEYKVKK